jgi:hypothetical protein
MLDGVTLGCAVGALLRDSVVGAMLDGVTLGCAVGALLGFFLQQRRVKNQFQSILI